MSMSLPTVGAGADAGQASRLTSRAQAPVRISPDAKASAMRIRRGGTRDLSYDTDPGSKTSPYLTTQPLRKTRQIRAAQSRSRRRLPFFRCRQAAGISHSNSMITRQAEPAKNEVR